MAHYHCALTPIGSAECSTWRYHADNAGSIAPRDYSDSVRSLRARSDPPSGWRGYVALLSGLGIVTFYTIGGFFVLYGQFEPVIDQVGIEEVMLRLITHTHIYLSPGTQAFFFERALSTLCLSAVLYGMFSLLRPVAAT